MNIKFIIYIVIILGLFFLLNKIYINIQQDENHMLQYQNFQKKNKSSKILILGDSYSAYGIQPKHFEGEIFNFAFPGDNLKEMEEKLKISIQKGGFQQVILASDYHLFKKKFKISPKYQSIFEPEKMNFMQKNIPLFYSKNRYALGKIGISFVYHAIKSRQFKVLKSIYFDEDLSLRKRNQYKWSENKNKDRKLKEALKDFFSDSLNLEKNIKHYQNIINLCKYNNIELIGLRHPVSNEYHNYLLTHYPKELQKIDSLKNIIFQDLTFIDHQKLFQNHQDYFIDAIHLNLKGAEVFSEKLKSDLIEISQKEK